MCWDVLCVAADVWDGPDGLLVCERPTCVTADVADAKGGCVVMAETEKVTDLLPLLLHDALVHDVCGVAASGVGMPPLATDVVVSGARLCDCDRGACVIETYMSVSMLPVDAVLLVGLAARGGACGAALCALCARAVAFVAALAAGAGPGGSAAGWCGRPTGTDSARHAQDGLSGAAQSEPTTGLALPLCSLLCA